MCLTASCNQVARACWSSGAILARNALRVGPIRPCVSRMAGVTTAGLYFVRFLLSAIEAALPTRPAASTQNGEVTWTSMSSSAFWTPVLEILTSILAPFSGSHGRVVHEDFDVCTNAGSSRNVRDFVSQSVVPRRKGSHTGLHNRILAACWNAELCTIGVLEVGSWRNPEAPGSLALSRATRCLLLAPMWSRRSLVALLTRERARARCEVAVEPILSSRWGLRQLLA